MAAEQGAKQESPPDPNMEKVGEMVDTWFDNSGLTDRCASSPNLTSYVQKVKKFLDIFLLLPPFCQHVSSIRCTGHSASSPGSSWDPLHRHTELDLVDVTWPQQNKKDQLRLQTSRNQKVPGPGLLMKDVNVKNKSGVIFCSPGSQFVFDLRLQFLSSNPYMYRTFFQ